MINYATGTLCCRGCDRDNLSPEDFTKDRASPNGLHSRCRECKYGQKTRKKNWTREKVLKEYAAKKKVGAKRVEAAPAPEPVAPTPERITPHGGSASKGKAADKGNLVSITTGRIVDETVPSPTGRQISHAAAVQRDALLELVRRHRSEFDDIAKSLRYRYAPAEKKRWVNASNAVADRA